MPYVLMTDEELEAGWKAMELPANRIRYRDVRHLETLADMECYDQYCNREEGELGFWKSMTHRARISSAVAGKGATVTLYASNHYFIDRIAVRYRVYDHGEGVKISFGGWMDTETLEVYQSIFRKWMDVMKEVTGHER